MPFFYLLALLERVHEPPVELPDRERPEPEIRTEALGRAQDVGVPLVGEERALGERLRLVGEPGDENRSKLILTGIQFLA